MVEKNKNNTVILMVSTMILIIVGIAFLTSISDQTTHNTQKTIVTDEQVLLSAETACPSGAINTSYVHTLTNAPTGWKTEDSDCYITGLVVTNSSGSAFTVTTDYVLDSDAGTLTFKNTALVNQSCATGDNITLVDYQYCGDNYLSESWGRSILNVNVGLFALAILIGAIALVYLLLGKNDDD